MVPSEPAELTVRVTLLATMAIGAECNGSSADMACAMGRKPRVPPLVCFMSAVGTGFCSAPQTENEGSTKSKNPELGGCGHIDSLMSSPSREGGGNKVYVG